MGRFIAPEIIMSLTRRDFVRTALVGSALGGGYGPTRKPAFPGLIVRAHQPRNLEFPISELKDAIVPNEQFFVRSHFAAPEINAKTWKLVVEGEVESKLEFAMEDFAKMPVSKLTATIECAGNGRVHLTPPVPGLQWGQGAVGNAVWEGVYLSELLKRVGAKKSAVEVILERHRRGGYQFGSKSPGTIHYARSLPMEKANSNQGSARLQDERRDTANFHGFPLRASWRLVRDGKREMAEADHRHRQAVRRLLSNAGLLVLRPP